MSGFRPYQAISALAGSGKTYQLTSRYIALLAMGVAPSRIVAITFTRKAASEIFDRIVRRLAEAALSDSARVELERAVREQLGNPELAVSGEAARGWLAALIEAMPRLRIGTIDSLFATVVKAFALELGLPPRQEMLEGLSLDHARKDALSRAFRDVEGDAVARAAFLEAFKLATSAEKRNVRETILEMVNAGHEIFLDLPEPEAWGDKARVWPQPAWWDANESPSTAGIIGRVDGFARRHLGADKLSGRYIEAWGKLMDFVRACDWDAALETTMAGKLLAVRDALSAGCAEIEYYKKAYELRGADADDAWHFIAAMTRGAIGFALKETQGMYRLLASYENACREELRGKGRLTFADIPLLLGRMCASDIQLDIDYRLDGRIDHWMLDEFQDTNARQWRVIGRLADEVLQSTEPDRSFFYVGDVKQAIYAWRGGESTLFEDVRAYYSRRFGDAKDLETSWRSSPVVLDAVNRAFGALKSMASVADSYPQVAASWAKRWKEHQAAPPNEKLPGRVELHEVDAKAETDGESARIALTCRIVRDLVDRGVPTIGVLVRLNSYGDVVADALRRSGLQVRRERNARLLDNGVVSALVSMLALADHPGDLLSGPHLAMTPLLGALARWMSRDAAAPNENFLCIALAARLRETAARHGVAGLLGQVIDACRGEGLLEGEFVGMRLRQLLDAAAEFDLAGEGGPGEFARQVESLEVSDPGAEGRVVVMTVHKAKGLEYDAVILPDLQGPKRQWSYVERGDLKVGRCGTGGRAGPVNPAEEDPGSRWVLPFPNDALASADPTLGSFAAQAKELKVAEELCLLYVAMTRARQGLYLIADEPGKASVALCSARFLAETLADPGPVPAPTETYHGIASRLRYAGGDAGWPSSGGRAREDRQGLPDAIETRPFSPPTGVARRLAYRTPSSEERGAGSRPAHLHFAAGRTAGAERGAILHDLFSRIEWLEAGAGAAAMAGFEAEQGPCPAEIRSEFLHALESPEVATALRRPPGRCDVWREQAFEFAKESVWVSGRMDRVVVERDAGGAPVSAQVIDFKSDRADGACALDELKAQYAPQIGWYVAVVSRLLALPSGKIRSLLVLTQTGRVLEVDAPPELP
jgi:ATP-dependent exoDNAse (exonuclease V) beta subunit